ncbi:hypothetical protein BD324DRAFT_631872 [Kockovaella imperatae]|uniref:EamA domain-containing protein n=1 Tax=Kockovaella imperatae TaxID=4999 RepID=A0A1Y1UB11_9TREE|nr:hypothetical protein BD324DRAFT_631872 [Kockovaella imperatae]ORX35223.1 hypothetical protein BD324DRAFT_631872 [Kockovaella imperatae]
MEAVAVGEVPKASLSAWRKDPTRYITGLIYLLIVVVLWTVSNFITAALEAGSDTYNKPFLITYLNTSTFTLYLLPSLLKHRKASSRGHYEAISHADIDPHACSQSVESQSLAKLTVRETAIVSAWWSIGWFLANFMITLSLAMTSVSSAVILSATSGFFTLALGSVFGVEKPTRTNISSVLLSFLGVVLVARSDSSQTEEISVPLPSHPIWGDLAAIISALCYGGYVVLLKVKLVDEDRADSMLMLGFAGLYQTVALIPVFPILHWTGLERFQLPPTRRAWLLCLANMSITFASDYLYILALLKTSPMLVTLGLSMTIPLTLAISIVDPALSVGTVTFLSLIGASMVLGAFVLLSWEGTKEDEQASPPIDTGREGGL